MSMIIFAAFIGVCAAGALPAYVPPQYRFSPAYYQDGRARSSLEGGAAILRSESEVNEQGFHYAYDTENGISAEASGVEANGIQSQGRFSYTGDDGQVYAVTYTADANGYQPQGSHLPTPPPIPEAIARSLQENARDEAAGIFDDGSYRDAKYEPAVIAARAQYPYAKGQYVNPAFRRFYKY
ncbi:cuticle protein 3-like [Bombyx mandarina]|uniref:Cuticle protein 3-like n=2 Tax=Bombyx TaxID=7090 RepID=A0A6J2KB28_BOMMA|nr:cuticular protein RR-1 motif 19 precursor [Bombyx mori]XP_028038868.1 cuticle protein 3-like [Bombyx mandarina]XP_037873376.1 cuticular protein RR-1 motif 19 isoform X1 [Bombyx mori]FAA00521.1 TPA: putative cuticle protein [Bombyx mori]